jgi:DNA replication factor GINS
MMDLDELQSVRDRERQTDKLQQLRESFYADAGEFIQDLRDERDRAAERADDPFDAPEVSRLSDEIDTAEVTVEAIYEKRVGKIVKAASFAAADLPAQDEGMTREERDLFETLVENIRSNREHVLDVLAGEAPGSDAESPGSAAGASPTRDDVPATETDPDGAPAAADRIAAPADAGPGGVDAADAMGGSEPASAGHTGKPGDRAAAHGDADSGSADDGRATADQPTADQPTGRSAAADTAGRGGRESPEPPGAGGGTAGVERETVRITDDVGDIVGVDQREYDLSRDDVVQLPAANAAPLVERDAAERLD